MRAVRPIWMDRVRGSFGRSADLDVPDVRNVVSGPAAERAAREHAGILKVEELRCMRGRSGQQQEDGTYGRYRQSFPRLCGRRAAIQPRADGRRHRAWCHCWRAARPWRRQWCGNPAAADVLDVTYFSDHHAVLHLLGRVVRRCYHFDLVQYSGRTVVGGDDFRRLSDGAERSRRRSTHRRIHIVFRRRAVRRNHHYACGSACRELRIAVRPT